MVCKGLEIVAGGVVLERGGGLEARALLLTRSYRQANEDDSLLL